MPDSRKSETPRRPLVRYHGGKWMLAPWIISHFVRHRCYVEPYGGGLSVLLRKSRAYTEVVNDLDEEIVNVWCMARNRGEDLVRALKLTPFARVEFERCYEETHDPLERARRTIVRSFMGFGSGGIHGAHRTGFRADSTKSGTTPAHDWAHYPEALEVIVERLRGVVIEKRPALKVMRRHDSVDTLHYVDPPYVHSTRSRVDAARGYHHELTDDDHRELIKFLGTLRGFVFLSGYPSPLYDELLQEGWVRRERRAHADGALDRTECLWVRNVPAECLPLEQGVLIHA